MKTLTPASLALFEDLIADAPDWSGSPLVDLASAADKGNLTDLKKTGLVTTSVIDGSTFVWFTPEGIAFADSLGLDTSWKF
jgi:hypothetical protein